MSVFKGILLGFAAPVAALCLSLGAAQATLIAQDDASVSGPDSGDGSNLTHDDVSGLSWLDLSVTRGMSRNQVLASSLITGGAYRFATDVEVDNLFATNVGISFGGGAGQTTPFFATPSIVSAGVALINLLGVTNGQTPIGSFGLVDNATTLPGGFNRYAIRQTSPSNLTIGLIRLSTSDFEASSGGFAGFGSFLVQASATAPIPEPGSLALFGLGGAALAAVARRRRKRA